MRPLRLASNRSNGGVPGHEGEHGVFLPSLGAVVDRQRRLVELAGRAAVEVGVFLGLDLGARLGPQRGAVGDFGGLGAWLVHDGDRHRNVAGLIADDPLQLEALDVVLGAVHQLQHHAGAARRRCVRGDWHQRERAFAVGRPQPRLVRSGAAGEHIDPLGDHEGRIEAHSELTDQRRTAAALRGLDSLHERPGARAGDGAQRLHHFVPAHADAVVLDRDLLLVGVDGDRDAQLWVIAQQGRVGDRLVAQLLAGIGGVGDQLAQEDVPVGIDRVHHHVEQLGDVGLEGAVFGFDVPGGIGHGRRQSPGYSAGHQMGRRPRLVKGSHARQTA